MGTTVTFINGSNASEILQGTLGHDVIRAGAGDDTIFGGAGNDGINGDGGNDIINGGFGNDILYGGLGNDLDRYVFAIGHGKDVVIDTDDRTAKDSLEFLKINSTAAIFNRVGNDLRIWGYGGVNDEVWLRQYFDATVFAANKVFKFADKTINAISLTIKGTDANDTLTGSVSAETIYGLDGNDVIRAGDGNDTIWGGNGNDGLNGDVGNDIINGGAGNDVMYGGIGNDTDRYIFSIGHGRDTVIDMDDTTARDSLEFLSISSADAVFSRLGNDLQISGYGKAEDAVVVKQYFDTGVSNQNKVFKFADKTLMSAPLSIIGSSFNDVITGTDSAETISSLEGNDVIRAGAGDDLVLGGTGNDGLNGDAGNDVLNGGVGNDSLYGGAGDDTDAYQFSLGHGKDSASDWDDKTSFDYLIFTGAKSKDVVFSRQGDDLRVFAYGNTTDQVTVKRFFDVNTTANNKIFTFDGYAQYFVFANQAQTNVMNARQVSNIQFYNMNSAEVSFIREGNDLLIKETVNQTNRIVLRDYFWDVNGEFISFEFLNRKISYSDLSTGNVGITWNGTADSDSMTILSDRAVKNWTINGLTGNDRINVESLGNTIINGGEGDDSIHIFGSYGDRLIGGVGNDVLTAETSNSTLIGGVGNDYLNGVGSNNTYVFYKGHGQDVIMDRSRSNTIEMKDINFAEVKFTITDWASLTMYGYNGNDSIKFVTWYMDTEYPLPYMPAKLVFKDQTITWEQLTQNLVLQGSNADDRMWMVDGGMYYFNVPVTMYGGNGNDDLAGSYEIDTLYGEAGNDGLIGWSGNDYLDGGSGDDNLNGGEGDDVLSGDEGNDLLIGGTGNDTLYGGAGDDVFIFNRDDGIDTIVASTGNDQIKLNHINGLQDWWYSRNNTSLTIAIEGENAITIDNLNAFFTNANTGSISLANGTVITQTQVNQMIQGMAIDGSEVRNAAEWILPTPSSTLTITTP